MKVHLIKKQSIEGYVKNHAASRSSFTNWLNALKYSEWKTPGDILETFGSADLLGNASSRVIFNLGGNNYRMICKYAFGEKQVHLFVCWIGTHAEYTKICNEGKQHKINDY